MESHTRCRSGCRVRSIPSRQAPGATWATSKASGERPPWTQQKAKAGGRGPFRGHDGPGKSRSSHVTVGFRCIHIIITLTRLFENDCTSRQPSSSLLPPSNEAVPEQGHLMRPLLPPAPRVPSGVWNSLVCPAWPGSLPHADRRVLDYI